MWSKNALLRYGPVILALIAGVTFSIVTYFVFLRLEAGAGEAAFKHRAAIVVSSVRSRVEASITVISSIVSLYHSSTAVTREEFRSFTEPLLAENQCIQALEWIPRVVRGERETFERIARTEGYQDFQITEVDPKGERTPAVERDEYFPVLYVEPHVGNEAALGFDVGSEAKRLQALLTARDAGLVRASGPLELVQERAGDVGMLLFAPVYHGYAGAYRDEVSQRRASLLGFALGVIRVKQLVARATAHEPGSGPVGERGFDLYLYDDKRGERGEGHLLAFHRPSAPHLDAPLSQEHDVRSGLHLAATFDVAGRTWTLVVRQAEGVPLSGRSWVPRTALSVGLAFTASLAAILLVNAHRSRLQDQLVEVLTEELQAIRDQLRADSAEGESAQTTLRELSKITKYLSPQLYASISTGEKKVQIASQHKKLTVFFGDIAEFTNAVDLLDAEDVTKLLNEYLTEMSRIALQYGGTVDKYIGDGIVIFFGDPESRGVKRDAAQCIRMAVAMQERMRQLQSGWEALGVRNPLKCRMGISTGYCMVGNFGSEERMDYTIVGSGVNLASRLETAAPPGTILISHETYVLVKDGFCCEEQQPISVKGFGDPIENYRVIDEWDKVPERESVIRADLPSVKLEINLRTLSNGDREQTVAALQRALRHLESSDAMLRQAGVADYTRILDSSWTSQLNPQTSEKV